MHFDIVGTKKRYRLLYCKVGRFNQSNLAHAGVTLLQRYISSRISTGEFRAHNTEVTARCLFSTVIMFHLTRDIFKGSKASKSQFVDEMLYTLLQAIGGLQK